MTGLSFRSICEKEWHVKNDKLLKSVQTNKTLEATNRNHQKKKNYGENLFVKNGYFENKSIYSLKIWYALQNEQNGSRTWLVYKKGLLPFVDNYLNNRGRAFL